jgi:hypothetical protein
MLLLLLLLSLELEMVINQVARVQCVSEIKLTAFEEVALELRANYVRCKPLFAFKANLHYQFKAIV